MRFPVPPSRRNIVDLRGMPDYTNRINPKVTDPFVRAATLQLLQSNWSTKHGVQPEAVARMQALARLYASLGR